MTLRVHHTGISTLDLARLVTFYCDELGFEDCCDIELTDDPIDDCLLVLAAAFITWRLFTCSSRLSITLDMEPLSLLELRERLRMRGCDDGCRVDGTSGGPLSWNGRYAGT